MYTRKDRDAAEIDRIVGDRIRRRRILLGYTQDQLGEALGISYQQIQKYETGANRVSAGRLYQIAETLQVNIGWFFDGAGRAATDEDIEEVGSPRHVIELVRGFSRLPDDKTRTAVLSLVRTLSDVSEDSDVETQAPQEAPKSNGHGNGAGPSPHAPKAS